MKQRHLIIFLGSICCLTILAGPLLAAADGDDYEHRPLKMPSDAVGRDGGTPWIVTVLIALAVIVAGIYLLLRLLRRFFPALAAAAGPSAPIKSLARFHLAPRQALHLVRCGNRLLVLGATATSINHVATIDNTEEIDQILQAIRRGETPLAGLARFFHRSSEQVSQTPEDSPEHSGEVED